MNGYIVIGYPDVALAALLVLADAGISLALQLGLHRQLLVAAVRMVLQLSVMGLVLTTLFSIVSPLWTGVAAVLMVLVSGREIAARQQRQLRGMWSYGVGTVCMMMASMLVTVLALSTALRPSPWYDPRYALPLLGMVLGNAMTGIAIGLNSMTNGLVDRRSTVEAQLMLGVDRWRALAPVTTQALRNALMPIINSMSATGLVALPGMMTGQILGGVPPAEAVKYQMLIMFLIAGGTGFGAAAAVLSAAFRLTDSRHRLRLDRLAARKG